MFVCLFVCIVCLSGREPIGTLLLEGLVKLVGLQSIGEVFKEGPRFMVVTIRMIELLGLPYRAQCLQCLLVADHHMHSIGDYTPPC